jgi:diguanylate cyclase (GGDEF)-like protein
VGCKCNKKSKINIRKIDIFCRYGGEEFIIVLPKTPLKYAKDVAEVKKNYRAV